MALIQPTTQPARWLINTTEYSGLTEIGQATGVNNDFNAALVWAEGDEAFLAAAAGKVSNFPALPATGVWCEINSIYAYDDGAVICRQSHYRTAHAPVEIPALWLVHRADAPGIDWIAGEQVQVGTRRTYGGVLYSCLQAHVTQSDWTPPAVPALWAVVTPPSPFWAYPVAYKIGDEVIYQQNGLRYRCRQAHTSQAGWTPPAVLALWLPI